MSQNATAGLKPALNVKPLRGAELPLFHVAAYIPDFFCMP
jgi:hypothetical protein